MNPNTLHGPRTRRALVRVATIAALTLAPASVLAGTAMADETGVQQASPVADYGDGYDLGSDYNYYTNDYNTNDSDSYAYNTPDASESTSQDRTYSNTPAGPRPPLFPLPVLQLPGTGSAY